MRYLKILLIGALYSFASFGSFLPKDFEANFTQTFISSLSKKEKITHGKIAYKHPTKLYFEITGAEPIIYISNEKKSWIYTPPFVDGERGSLRISDSSKHSFTKFFDALALGLVTNKLYSVRSAEKEALLEFSKEVAKQIGIAKAKLIFKTSINEKSTLKDVKKIIFNYLVKKPEVTLEFLSFEDQVILSDEKFNFSIPKNTEIINED